MKFSEKSLIRIIIIGILLLPLSKIPAFSVNSKLTYGEKTHIFDLQPVSGEKIYKTQCGFCHTSEELIAPDMNKIKSAYLDKYKTKDAFVKAVIEFVKNPNKKNALYKEGIENFADMPKMPFKETQLKAVANYIYKSSEL